MEKWNSMKKSQWRNRIQRIFGGVLLLCLLLSVAPLQLVGATTEEASLQSIQEGTMKLRGKNFEILLRYGVSGKARYGRDCLMTGTVTSGTLPNGSIEFTLKDSDGETQIYAVSLAEKEQGEQFFVVLPMHRYLTNVNVSIKNEKQEVLTERDVPLQCMMFSNGQVIGVLSEDVNSSSYSYLSSFGNYLLMLAPENVPTHIEGLDYFDILLMDGYPEGLSEEAAVTISQWVTAGGTLVVGTGAKGEATLDSLEELGVFTGNIKDTVDFQSCYGMTDDVRVSMNKSIMEYEAARNQLTNYITDSDITGTGSNKTSEQCYVGESISHFYSDKNNAVLYAAETIKLCRFTPTDAIAVVKEAGETLLSTQKFGEGQIEWFAFSLARRSFDYYGVYFAHNIRAFQSEKALIQQQNSLYGGSMDSVNYAALLEPDETREQQIIPYILLFLVYLALIGPVSYLLLRRKNRGVWIYALLPLLSLAFLVITYGIGQKTRISKPYITYVEVVREEQNEVKANLYFTAAAPTGSDWKLNLSNGVTARLLSTNVSSFYDMVYLSQADFLPSNSRHQVKVQYNDSDTELSYSGLSPFSEVEALIQYDTEAPLVDGEKIQLSSAGVQGSISNSSQTSFDESYLVYNGVLVKTGEILPGEVINLEEKEQTVILASSAMNLYYTNNGYQQLSSEEQLSREYIFENFAGNATPIYFVGITQQLSANHPLNTSGDDYTLENGLTMYVLDEIGEGVKPEVNFGVLTDDMMQVIEGAYTPGDKYRAVSSDTTIVEYTLKTKNKLDEISFLPFYNQAYNSYYAIGWEGNIYLYNVVTGNYDLLSDTYEEDIISYPDNYVSDKNVIRVKFEKRQMYEGLYMELPCLTYSLSDMEKE